MGEMKGRRRGGGGVKKRVITLTYFMHFRSFSAKEPSYHEQADMTKFAVFFGSVLCVLVCPTCPTIYIVVDVYLKRS